VREREGRTVTVKEEGVEFGDKGRVVGGKEQPGHSLHGVQCVVLASKSVAKTVGDEDPSLESEGEHGAPRASNPHVKRSNGGESGVASQRHSQ